MKTRKLFAICLMMGMTFLAIGTSEVFAAGTAKATGTNKKAGAKRADVVSKRGTGGLTVRSVTVLDKFGREKRVNYTIKGDTSTSPTIEFDPGLDAEDYVRVEFSTGNSGDHGYLDLKFS